MQKLLLVLSIVTLAVSFVHAEEPKAEVKIIAAKSHSVYFNVDESFVGGSVEVLDVNGKLVLTGDLKEALVKLYLHELPSGRYNIKVIKGKKSTEFGYVTF